MNNIQALNQLGQSVWFDYIRRSFITSGKLQSWIDKGVSGVTSNPAIFEKAISGSDDYDRDLKRLARANLPLAEVYETLALEDIALAADTLRSVYDGSHGRDGYVSLEVNPLLAGDTDGTVDEAKRLFSTLGRSNVMIKVPATAAGIPAIAELIGSGVNVNVTLIFSLANYEQVTGAYLSGLERLSQKGPTVTGGHPVDRVASVASFFVSRVDSAVDKALAGSGAEELAGRIAISNSKVVYRRFGQIFSGARWEALAAKGAGVQRVLWASTSTKNPDYPDTLYVDELIGPHTVNTIPPATLDAFMDHGKVAETLMRGVDEAHRNLERLAAQGIDLERITDILQVEGVAAFAKPFEKLMQRIAVKLQAFQQPPPQ